MVINATCSVLYLSLIHYGVVNDTAQGSVMFNLVTTLFLCFKALYIFF
jgi:hypothetical protein